MKEIAGSAASSGIVTGPVFLYCPVEYQVKKYSIDDPAEEWTRCQNAIDAAQKDLQILVEKLTAQNNVAEAHIFEAHIAIAQDPELVEATRGIIENEHINAEAALEESSSLFVTALEALDNEYLKARAGDIRDVVRRVNMILLGVEDRSTPLQAPSIIVADDLTPSDTASFDRSLVLGFCMEKGSATSHAAILARAMGVPAVMRAAGIFSLVESGQPAVLDGDHGKILLDPTNEVLAVYQAQQESQSQKAAWLKSRTGLPAVTQDGHAVQVAGNIGGEKDAQEALSVSAEGIGLFRTEFLYIDHSSLPDESGQASLYQQVLDTMGPKYPVVFRTLDIGGDKPLQAVPQQPELNPFLGLRGLRLCLANPETLFKPQVRALLRAAAGKQIHIMFPMVTSISEVRQARALVEQCQAEILQEGHGEPASIQLGIMVEVPAAALMADCLAAEVDFFSIGTNDLTQYTLAADRTNSTVAYLSDGLEPAVLRLIQQVIVAAHVHNRWVGICGELAGDPQAIPVLVGLGVDELSMSPTSIPRAKEIVRTLSYEEAKLLAQRALGLCSASEVRQLLEGKESRRFQ